MTFANSQIDTNELPAVSQVGFQKLAPAFRNVEYIGTAIFSFVLLIGALVVFLNIPERFWWVGWATLGVWALIFAGGIYLAGKQYEMAGYALRQHDVIHKHGVWWQTVTTIPFNRMQHCEISQGPIQNLFGLATLRVFTAGGTSSDLAIDGLEKAEAQRVKEFITGKIRRKAEKAQPQNERHDEDGEPDFRKDENTPNDYDNLLGDRTNDPMTE